MTHELAGSRLGKNRRVDDRRTLPLLVLISGAPCRQILVSNEAGFDPSIDQLVAALRETAAG